MPIYEFECPEHGRFESLENSLVDRMRCSTCAKIALRVPSIPAVAIFKEPVHTSGIPMSIHNTLVNKNRDRYEGILRKQGRALGPEDIGE